MTLFTYLLLVLFNDFVEGIVGITIGRCLVHNYHTIFLSADENSLNFSEKVDGSTKVCDE